MIELILMKAAFKLWTDLWTTDPHPNSHVSRTLALVCYDWTALLIERKWVRRYLRKRLKGDLLIRVFRDTQCLVQIPDIKRGKSGHCSKGLSDARYCCRYDELA